MVSSLRAENIKVSKRWANWIMFGILLGLVILLYLITHSVLTNPPKNFRSPIPASVLVREDYPENLLPNVFSTTSSLGAGIMIIFGGLSMGSEYGWLTVQTMLLQKPGRVPVLLGKLANTAIVTFIVSVLVLASAALLSFLIAKADGASSSFPSSVTLLKGFGALWLELALWAVFGMFLGVAFRSTAAAIGGGLVFVLVVESLVNLIFRDNDTFKWLLQLLPGNNVSAVNAQFPLSFRNPEAAAPLVSAGRGVTTLLVYLAIFIVLSLVIFQRRDVTT